MRVGVESCLSCSLPYRQLRKSYCTRHDLQQGSLPYRQLRSIIFSYTYPSEIFCK
ncbi:hypothetical protein L292_1209 [Acinetobacter junii CIP 107470 = MTCC 11364]|uniref:Uncharacterized protein n=1 Tax=Acinetobacter junii CIP 107470 = MTCC 11364 TaxID=1217666 RepID=S7WDS2_ACIJU|nr:hypothetical protein L292_1209 [Acinetobacter junii CIP 107470 = MTCC 11364]